MFCQHGHFRHDKEDVVATVPAHQERWPKRGRMFRGLLRALPLGGAETWNEEYKAINWVRYRSSGFVKKEHQAVRESGEWIPGARRSEQWDAVPRLN